MIKAVLPGMRARRRGAIVNISSIGAQVAPPGSGYYSATKAALEGMTDCAAQGGRAARHQGDVGRAGRIPHRLRRPLAEPVARRRSPTTPTPPGKRRKENDTARRNQPGDPVKAAKAIIVAVESDETPLLLLLGPDAVERFRAVEEEQRAELDKWEPVSLSTDF